MNVNRANLAELLKFLRKGSVLVSLFIWSNSSISLLYTDSPSNPTARMGECDMLQRKILSPLACLVSKVSIVAGEERRTVLKTVC